MKSYNDYVAISITITALIIFILMLVFLHGGFTIPACIFITKFGIYCPACGATRAFIHLLKGNLIKSFLSNPSVLYISTCIIIYFVLYIYIKLTKKDEKLLFKYSKIALYIGILIVVVNFAIRNILLYLYNIHIN